MGEQTNQVQLKNFNRRTVLNYIRKNKTATKAGLASVTGLTFMAIKKILEELEELHLIRCDEMEAGGMGRRAVTYAVNETYRYVVGIHINKFVTSIAMMDLRGEILEVERCSMQQDFPNQSAFVEMLVSEIEKVIQRSGIEKDNILGIGVGVPGPVDTENGVILTPPNIPMLSYLPLKEILESKCGCSVYVQKDTNVIAFGEYWYGSGSIRGSGSIHGSVPFHGNDCYDLAYVDVDMGIGSGLIIDGKLNIGANSIAGEFGHITIDINGPLCNCGNKGCLEAMSSGIAVLRELKAQLEKEPGHPLYAKREDLVIEDVFKMAEKKDLLTISILNQSAFYVGVAVSNLINILDPQIIILGGILIQKYPRYFDIVTNVANARKVKGAKENFLAVSKLGENAGVIGAGEIVADNFFNEKVNEVFCKNA
nr:ROK family protein [uncultured Eisenbergiella sp.]